MRLKDIFCYAMLGILMALTLVIMAVVFNAAAIGAGSMGR